MSKCYQYGAHSEQQRSVAWNLASSTYWIRAPCVYPFPTGPQRRNRFV